MAAHTTSRLVFLSASIFLFNVINLPFLTNALSSCNGACSTSNDCDGQLICINGNCNDDPDVGTQICSGDDMPSPSGEDCQSSGTLNCDDGKSFSQFTCSPQVLSSTQAILTLNDFSEGGDGGAPSECDGKFHSNSEKEVALSTGWYNKGSRCGQMITITSATSGKSVEAVVVDECDSVNGCDSEHANQGLCRNNIVDGSQAVWDALGLDSGEESVTWSMA